MIQPFQQPERVIGFFNAYRNAERVTRNRLRDVAQQFQNWLKNHCEKWGVPVLDAPEGRRDDFVDPYFKQAKTEVVVILKAREPARIMIAIGSEDRWHLQLAQRWIVQYNFYINDQRWGRMFVRICPYLPFSARVCLNQHHWLAKRMLTEGIDFKQCSNAFLKCSHPGKLQELADSLTAQDLLSCGQKWLACLTPFFKESERKEAGCQHRLFFSQVEYCDNLIFHRRAALDQLGQRMLDANRTIGQPNKITMIFGRKVTKHYKGKLQTVIEDLELPNPVIRSHYAKGFLKRYVRDHLCLRTEPASNDVTDYGVKMAVENLPQLRDKLATICDNYLTVQQDILETFVDRGQLRKLSQPDASRDFGVESGRFRAQGDQTFTLLERWAFLANYSTSRYDKEKRKYHPTARRITSGSNWRHLKQTGNRGNERHPSSVSPPDSNQHAVRQAIRGIDNHLICLG